MPKKSTVPRLLAATALASELGAMPAFAQDTVPGGASAPYGSDAVSGGVNILLRREFDGVRVRAQTGMSEESDAKEKRIGVLGGWNSDDDRAHIVFSADDVDQDGVGDIYNRAWGRRETMIVQLRSGMICLR